MTSETLLEGVNYYSTEKAGFLHGNIILSHGKIKSLEETEGNNGDYIIPGFVNTHAHVAMSRFRGHLDDMRLDQFLEKTFRLDAQRSEEDIYHSTVAGIYEMLSNGITSFMDLYYSEDIIYRAVEDMGIRANLSWNTLDREFTTQIGDPVDNCENFISEYGGKNPLIQASAGIQGVYVCSLETMTGARDIAAKHHTILHMHASETRKEVYEFQEKTGKRPVQYMLENDIIRKNTNAAHCVWLNGEEIQKLGRVGASVSWNSVSNHKLGVGGIPSIPELTEAGANVAIGTDSNGSNNTLNILETAKSGSLAVKNARWDASMIKAGEMLEMLTSHGGKAFGLEKLGTIQEGAPADLLILDRDHYSLQPYGNERIASNIVYSMNPSAITGMIIGGKWIKKDGAMDKEIKKRYRESARWINTHFSVS